MKVTFIRHSSFLVELEQLYLLFDYTEGILPDLNEGKALLVLASHRHSDHFSREIFHLGSRTCDVQFLLSDDIWQRQVPEQLFGKTIFIDPGQQEHLEIGSGVDVEAYASTDEGVAFLVRTEGKTIYHAGDLNNWMWKEEGDEWNKPICERYRREIDKMRDHPVDAAFVPLDPRQEEWFYLGMDDYMTRVDAKVVFPMHFWGDFSVIRRMKALACAAGYQDRIAEIIKEGQEFLI